MKTTEPAKPISQVLSQQGGYSLNPIDIISKKANPGFLRRSSGLALKQNPINLLKSTQLVRQNVQLMKKDDDYDGSYTKVYRIQNTTDGKQRMVVDEKAKKITAATSPLNFSVPA